MHRPDGVNASIGLFILGGLACLVMGALMAVTMQMQPPPEARQTGLPVMALVLVIAGFFVGIALWAFVTAGGLVLMKPWSRISSLFFAGMLIFFQTGGLLLVLFTLLSQPREFAIARWWVAGFTVFYGSQILVGIWWLIYFNRKTVKVAFLSGVPADANPSPLSIAVIAWHLVAFGVIFLGMAGFAAPATVLGVVLWNWPARVANLLWGAASLYVGAGLQRLRSEALNQAIAYVYAVTLNTVLYWCMPDMAAQTIEMLRAHPMSSPGAPASGLELFGPLMWLGYGLVLLLYATPLWYLHTRKAQYLAAAAARWSKPRS